MPHAWKRDKVDELKRAQHLEKSRERIAQAMTMLSEEYAKHGARYLQSELGPSDNDDVVDHLRGIMHRDGIHVGDFALSDGDFD